MKKYLLLFVISTVFVSCSNDNDEPLITRSDSDLFVYDECLNIPHPEDTWVQPAYPGTAEWEELHARHADDIAGVYEELLPPADVVAKMSTEGLVHSYIDYTYASEALATAFNSYYPMVVNFLNSPFGQEMVKRSDSAFRLTNIYRDFNPLCDDEKAQVGNVHGILLRMMSAEEIHNQLSLKEKKEFVKIALEKLDLCNSVNKGWETFYAFTCGRIMKSAGYAPLIEAMNSNEVMQRFLEYWPYSDAASRGVEDIIQLANDFIN